MSKPKHTPGPWIYLPEKCRIVTAYPNRVEVDYGYEDPSPISIIDTYGAMGSEDTCADAHLMAAAPELLRILSDCLFQLTSEYPRDEWKQYYPFIIEGCKLVEQLTGVDISDVW